MLRRLLVSLTCVSIATSFVPARAVAQVTTSEDASVLVFPYVVADADHDTVLQVVNGAPRRTFIHCVYTPGGGGANQELAFDLVLVTRQPTHWVASTGRLADPSDDPCARGGNTDCDGAGLDPGRIPPLPAGFQGDLLCVEVDRSRAPLSGNALRGTATLLDTSSGDLAKYAAVGLPGRPANDADGTLCLGGEASDGCPRGAEYAACPASWLLEQRADGAAVGDERSAPTSRGDLVLVTCSRRAGTGAAAVQIFVTNEFEQRLSASLQVQRWARVALADLTIFDFEVVGSDSLQAGLQATPSSPGIAVVALSRRVSGDGAAAGGAIAAVPHAVGVRAAQDRIVLIAE